MINEGVVAPSKEGKQAPRKRGKGKGKAPIVERPEHNFGSDGEFAHSHASFSEPEDDQLLQTSASSGTDGGSSDTSLGSSSPDTQ
uniref:Uncharacterized protein n=1 Tax=Solanum tuberosum TaxID=4113 RepID=M1DHB1_SOLTU